MRKPREEMLQEIEEALAKQLNLLKTLPANHHMRGRIRRNVAKLHNWRKRVLATPKGCTIELSETGEK